MTDAKRLLEEDESKYYADLHDFVNSNHDKYFDEYVVVLKKYGINVTFIIGKNRLYIMQIIGYGRRNITEVIIMKNLDSSGKKDHIKKLWQEDSEKYYEWKNWCIRLNRLPDFFGTRDNPIPIDEFEL